VRILVVDDHRNTLVSMSIGLRRSGHTVATAANADEALAALEGTTFDCAVCDMRMEPVGGLDLARAIRERWPLVAIVFMTAFHLTPAEKAVAVDLEAPCLLKPIRVEALLDTIYAVKE
jgi:CheY-like chemotaxis protein